MANQFQYQALHPLGLGELPSSVFAVRTLLERVPLPGHTDQTKPGAWETFVNKEKPMNRQAVSLRKFHFNVNSCGSMFAMALMVVFALTLLTTHAMQAQTFSVLHNFTGLTDGEYPYAGVTVASSGTLYGTTSGGNGTVYKLTPHASSFVFSPLYEFPGGSDGTYPYGGVVIGPNGALYGTTLEGGAEDAGIVFELRPPPTFCRSITCYWNESLVYTFTGNLDGRYPYYENLTFDQAGNIYGTGYEGGMYEAGVAFELTPSGGGYAESVLHSFGLPPDGANPISGVVLDAAGNVYGNTQYGGTGPYGTVYQLVPSNGGWMENVLVNFDVTNGKNPVGSLIIDGSGNLYGTTPSGGQNGGGVVYKLAPSGGGFTYSVLYPFSSCGSKGGLAMDAAGNLFGVCYSGGAHQDGWIFELTNCTFGCVVVDLHDFSGSDGANPYGGPVLGANGNLYGTTFYGGTGGCELACGVVWEIAGVGSLRR